MNAAEPRRQAGAPRDDGAPLDGEAPLDAYSRVVTKVARRLLPSVVSLRITAPTPGGRRPAGSGSAVAVAAGGELLTSAHVVAQVLGGGGGSATAADGSEVGFDVVGCDPLSDLAVLRVEGPGPPPAELGDADRLRVGQLVVAVGNPLGFAGSVSAGVVSALGRSFAARSGRTARIVEDVIQTDAALHPGSSGGALANGAGQVVGVNTALVGPGAGQGLGLAVPVNATTRAILEALRHHGRVRRAYLGIAGGTRPLPPRIAATSGRTHGVEVTSIVRGSPADDAGLRPEDLLVSIDGQPVETVGDLQRLMIGQRIGRQVAVEVLRAGQPRTVAVHPTELRDGP